MSLRDDLLVGRKPVYKDVEVIDAKGGRKTIRVRRISASDYLEYQSRAKTLADYKKERGEVPEEGDEKKLKASAIDLLIYTCHDPETGDRVFLPGDEKFLSGPECEWHGFIRPLLTAQDDVNVTDDLGKP